MQHLLFEMHLYTTDKGKSWKSHYEADLSKKRDEYLSDLKALAHLGAALMSAAFQGRGRTFFKKPVSTAKISVVANRRHKIGDRPGERAQACVRVTRRWRRRCVRVGDRRGRGGGCTP